MGESAAGTPGAAACTEAVCVTCSDEGRPGRVVAVPADAFAPALVRTEAGTEEVDVTLVAPVREGDVLLIHAGTAIGHILDDAGRWQT
jgi:hydrogenase maturation factor